MKNKEVKRLLAVMMLSVMAVSTTAESWQVHAAEEQTELAAEARSTVNTSQGVANFGRGTASITIAGNADQTLIGKKFHVYRLFNAQNSAGNESINYTFNPVFATPLKTVVGRKIGKPAASVTEYAVIDYIQSLNRHKVEGADTPQTPEGSYSDFRYFIEELRDEIVRQNVSGDIVNVTSVKSDNSVVFSNLEYGYYVVDEITSVDGTHSAASLCMVNTLNPSVKMNIKSDYPSVIEDPGGRQPQGDRGRRLE